MTDENVVDVLMPTIKHRIAHGRRVVSDHSETLQERVVRIVYVAKDVVPVVVKISVVLRIHRQGARFHNVPQ